MGKKMPKNKPPRFSVPAPEQKNGEACFNAFGVGK
jgi:hypothetical protein